MGNEQTILVLFGITGDLAQRKLLPALRDIDQEGLLPPTTIVGISRREVDAATLLRQAFGEEYDTPAVQALQAILQVYTMDLAKAEAYDGLRQYLDELQVAMGPGTQRLIYLSVPPGATLSIAEHLGEAGLNDASTKILLEKPFGVDLPSAEEAVSSLGRYFREAQLYRIDHYLAKEMAQNIIAFRSHNTLFRQLWRAEFIEAIDIIASEKIGIEGRAAFYEQTGALRDVIQNHLMQLLALTIMPMPLGGGAADVPALRLQALESLLPVRPDTFDKQVCRGQYRGYGDEAGNPGSLTETFASVTLYSSDPLWEGVPLRLATGKNLAQQTTEIRVRFRQAHDAEANLLVLHVQPKEGIEMALWAKKPGYEKAYEQVDLRFDYRVQAGKPVAAYERVLLDAYQSDKSLFTSAAEVLASWRVLQPVQERWALHSEDLRTYQPGTAIEELLA
jgi:glucose-6-phosphate 1-dehydrogenase